MRLLLIDPDYTQCRIVEGENVQDAIAYFVSSVWEQGWDANGRVVRTYSDWKVHQDNGLSWIYLGEFSRYAPTWLLT